MTRWTIGIFGAQKMLLTLSSFIVQLVADDVPSTEQGKPNAAIDEKEIIFFWIVANKIFLDCRKVIGNYPLLQQVILYPQTHKGDRSLMSAIK